jgi:hypothetical protein
MSRTVTEQWIDLRRSACVELRRARNGVTWLRWSPNIEHGPYRTRFAALLAASHALGLRGIDSAWRLVNPDPAVDRLVWYGRGRAS